MKIIGIEQLSFKGNDGTQVEGETLYGTETIDPKRGTGERADHFFMSKAKLAALDFTPTLGQTVEVLYNKFGKVAALRLVADDSGIIDFG